jgi:Zn-dependent protease with chaperone function
MSPLEYKLGANHRKRYYHAFKHNKKQREWLWLFAFLVICACNGWFLKVSSTISPVIIVFFAIFPVNFIFYSIYTRWSEKLLAEASHRDKINDVSIQTITIWYRKSTYVLRLSFSHILGVIRVCDW